MDRFPHGRVVGGITQVRGSLRALSRAYSRSTSATCNSTISQAAVGPGPRDPGGDRGHAVLMIQGEDGPLEDKLQVILSVDLGLHSQDCAVKLPQAVQFSGDETHAGQIQGRPSLHAAAIRHILLSQEERPRARREAALSGEITLSGRLLTVRGFREKLLAAPRASVKTVVLPKANEVDFRNLEEEASEGLDIILPKR